MKDGVPLIREYHSFETHLNRMRVLTGKRASISTTISSGKSVEDNGDVFLVLPPIIIAAKSANKFSSINAQLQNIKQIAFSNLHCLYSKKKKKVKFS